MKICSTCRASLDTSFFYKDRRNKDGLKSQCKKCHCLGAQRTRDPNKHRDNNKKWMRESRYASRKEVQERARIRSRALSGSLKVKARNLANLAIQKGTLKRPDCCSRCGFMGVIQAHHKDYTRPLDVEWLCIDCHSIRHRRVKNG